MESDSQLTLTIRPSQDPAASLWDRALQSLPDPEKYRARLNPGRDQTALSPIQTLLDETDNSRRTAAANSWSFEGPGGTRVIVRDVLARATKWIRHFKEIGDVAVSYDPAHAALPWAGFRFLLNVALGDIEVHGALVEQVASLAETISRAALVENAPGRAGHDELTADLVKLYAAILAFMGKARNYYEQNKAVRALKYGVLQSKSLQESYAKISEAWSALDSCCIRINLIGQLQTDQRLHRLHADFDKLQERWSPSLEKIQDHLQDAERRKALELLSTLPYVQYHKQAKENVFKGSGQWLLESAIYNDWLRDSASSILWLHGMPGSGKSKLVSTVIDHVQQEFREQRLTKPAYFYCSRNQSETERSDPARILACLAMQLAAPTGIGEGLLPPAANYYAECKETNFSSGPPTLSESCRLLLDLLACYTDSVVTIVIDALDECSRDTRDSLLDALDDILNDSPCLVKMFVSSRDDQDIVCALSRYPSLRLSSDLNSPDIKRYIHATVTERIKRGKLLRGSQRKEALGAQIIDELQANTEGMFRWAALQIEMLCRQKTEAGVVARLGKLPKELNSTYDDIFSDIDAYDDEGERNYVTRILSWLLCAVQQLKSIYFLGAVRCTGTGLAPEIDRDQLLYLCHNLVEYDGNLDIFRFSHLSVREYLEGTMRCTPSSANGLVAQACLYNVLHFLPGSDVIQKVRDNSWTPTKDLLQKYCVQHWGDHARDSDLASNNPAVRALMHALLCHEAYRPAAEAWRDILHHESYRSRDVKSFLSPDIDMLYDGRLEMCAICKFQMTTLLDVEMWATWKRRFGSIPEILTIVTGSTRVLQWCLEAGVEFDLSEDRLCEASWNLLQGADMLKLILDHRGSGAVASEVLLQTTLVYGSVDSLRLLLAARGPGVQITEAFVLQALDSHSRVNKFTFLLHEYGHQFHVTDLMVERVLRESASLPLLELLLHERGHQFRITEGITKAVASGFDSRAPLELLLHERGGEVRITEAVVKAAASSFHAWAVLDFLLRERGSEFRVTEAILRSAVDNYRATLTNPEGTGPLELFLRQRGHEFRITQDIVECAARWNPPALELLLRERRHEFQVTGDVVAAAVDSSHWVDVEASVATTAAAETLKWAKVPVQSRYTHSTDTATVRVNEPLCLLLCDARERRGQLEMDESVIRALLYENYPHTAASEKRLAFVLGQPECSIQVTEHMAYMAAHRGSLVLIKFIAERQGTEDFQVIKAIARANEAEKATSGHDLDEQGLKDFLRRWSDHYLKHFHPRSSWPIVLPDGLPGFEW